MAAARIGYRGNAIGISAGLGIALPLAAYAATLPFDGVNEAVRADALPFAAGIVAGVGMLALTGHLIDRHADRAAEEEAEAARFASLYGDSSARAGEASTATKSASQRGKRFAHGGTPTGVPVISRAVDALDEMEAWAEIDAMFSEDSPISCDPTRSKDMYQIALEELLKAERSAAQPQAAPTSAPSYASGTAQVQPQVQHRQQSQYQPQANASVQAGAQAYAAAYSQAPQLQQTVAAAMPPSAQPALDPDEANARDEAMAALYGDAVAHRSHAPVLPTMSPVTAQASTSPATAVSAAPVTKARDEEISVPVADYSGHEGMWAAALAILDDLDSAGPSIGSHTASVENKSGSSVETSYLDARRMAAIAEGGRATREHSHVNELIEEEFNRVPSKSVHHTAHEYLKVIEGGTAAMPALQTAEA